MKQTIDLAVFTLGPVLYVLLLGGAVLGLIVGIVLLVNSERVLRWNAALNRWYSTRQAFNKLDDGEVRRAIVELVERLAEKPAAAGANGGRGARRH